MAGENPFADQFAKLGIRSAGSDPAAEAAARKAAAQAAKPLREVVLGYERRGGGGAVTTVREVPAERRAQLLGALKRALGCGGTEDSGLLVFQGDHRARLSVWFERQGTRVRGERGG